MKNKIKKILSNKEGSVSIIVAFAMVLLIVVVAIVIDISRVYVSQAQEKNAFDAAALAGAQELPGDIIGARAVTEEYLRLNSVDPNDVTITIPTDGSEILIEGTKTVEYYFAKVLGINSGDFDTRSRIIIGTTTTVTSGLRPFAVNQSIIDHIKYEIENEIIPEPVVLKEGAGGGVTGFYGMVDFFGGGDGATGIRDDVEYGNQEPVKVGDQLKEEQGNMATVTQKVKSILEAASEPTEWTIPLVDDNFVVTGFAVFEINDIGKINGQTIITGKFLYDFMVEGSIGPGVEYTGAISSKLVE